MVEQDFWSGFTSAAGVYRVGEVFDGDPNDVCGFQTELDGLLNHPLWYPLTAAFSSRSGPSEYHQVRLQECDPPMFKSLGGVVQEGRE
jgi:hypothetical protein